MQRSQQKKDWEMSNRQALARDSYEPKQRDQRSIEGHSFENRASKQGQFDYVQAGKQIMDSKNGYPYNMQYNRDMPPQ